MPVVPCLTRYMMVRKEEEDEKVQVSKDNATATVQPFLFSDSTRIYDSLSGIFLMVRNRQHRGTEHAYSENVIEIL